MEGRLIAFQEVMILIFTLHVQSNVLKCIFE